MSRIEKEKKGQEKKNFMIIIIKVQSPFTVEYFRYINTYISYADDDDDSCCCDILPSRDTQVILLFHLFPLFRFFDKFNNSVQRVQRVRSVRRLLELYSSDKNGEKPVHIFYCCAVTLLEMANCYCR